MRAERYYRPSGRTGMLGVALAPMIAVASGAIVGVAYGLLTFISPIVYLNGIAMLLAAFAVGWPIGLAARLGEVRMPWLGAASGLLGGVVATQANWTAWLLGASGWKALVITPWGTMAVLHAMLEDGAWSIFRWTPKGWALASFWLVEAAVLILGSALIGFGAVTSRTYCERCARWLAPKKMTARLAAPDDMPALQSRLETGDLATLTEAPPPVSEAVKWLTLATVSCDGCRGLHAVTVNVVTKDAKGKSSETQSIDRLLVTHDQHQAIRQLESRALPG